MKTSRNLTYSLLFALTGIFIATFSSCQKEKASSPATSTDIQTSAQDVVQIESIFTDIDNLVAEASEKGTSTARLSSSDPASTFILSACATITNDTVSGILTIDFGTGCTGPHGRTRSGIIQMTYSGGRYFTPGSMRSITFINYYVDGRHIEGTRSTVNNGFNTAGNMNWTITASNMKVTMPNGDWHSWNDQRTREMTAGFGDSLWVNDVYLINGTGTSTNSNGGSAATTLTNLVRANSCHWIISGTIENIPSNRPARLLDFGNGNCDDLATVTVNGNTHTIHLRP